MNIPLRSNDIDGVPVWRAKLAVLVQGSQLRGALRAAVFVRSNVQCVQLVELVESLAFNLLRHLALKTVLVPVYPIQGVPPGASIHAE